MQPLREIACARGSRSPPIAGRERRWAPLAIALLAGCAVAPTPRVSPTSLVIDAEPAALRPPARASLAAMDPPGIRRIEVRAVAEPSGELLDHSCLTFSPDEALVRSELDPSEELPCQVYDRAWSWGGEWSGLTLAPGGERVEVTVVAILEPATGQALDVPWRIRVTAIGDANVSTMRVPLDWACAEAECVLDLRGRASQTIAPTYRARDESCNDADDDFDGAIDESFDLASDPRWCGDCETQCAEDQLCVDGVCRCPNGGSQCDGRCQPPSASCCGGHACPLDAHATFVCEPVGTAPSCVVSSCDPGWIQCGADVGCATRRSAAACWADAGGCHDCGAAACSNDLPTRENACVPTCPAGQMECSGLCVDTNDDPFDCGRCGVGCGEHRTCSAGRCGCEPPFTGDVAAGEACSCGGASCDPETEVCVDPDDSGPLPATCECQSGLVRCATGTCAPPTVECCHPVGDGTYSACPTVASHTYGAPTCVVDGAGAPSCVNQCAWGYFDCNANVFDGCETRSGRNNCASCGNVCPSTGCCSATLLRCLARQDPC